MSRISDLSSRLPRRRRLRALPCDALDADVEREHAYDLSVRLETQLGGMLDQLKDVVTKLNLSHDENGDEKSRDIMKIVNAHHQSLAYLSAQASKIEAEVVKLERANEAERRAQAV